MTVQVLVAAMHQSDHTLLEKMNIQSDAIVGNQCGYNSIEEFTWNEHTIKYLNFAERGVGLNRNNSLMRATGDICLFADDDMRYVDGYAQMIEKAFADQPEADVIVFNIVGRDKGRNKIVNPYRVNRLNYLKFGTARMAIKLSSVKRNGIYFNQCFGGGTEHCHGEDNLFLTMCLDKGLRIYAKPIMLAALQDERVSTWDTGDIEKYLSDQGVLYRTISRKWWRLLCIQDAFRRRKKYGMAWWQAYKKMIRSTN